MTPRIRWSLVIACWVLALAGLSLHAHQMSVNTDDTLRSCGNEGEEACGPLERDRFNQACDTGLQPKSEPCGCLVRGPFGHCLLPKSCKVCRNSTRHRPGTIEAFASSWAAWALRNQRDRLAVDEPVNWVMHLATHNAFNSFSDGHRPKVVDLPGSQITDAPNQFYSMTDQLNLGARALAIDAHWVGLPDNARLCHSLGELGPFIEQLLCRVPSVLGEETSPSMRYFANGIKEIRNWLDDHPDQIVVIDLENYVGTSDASGGEEGKTYTWDPIQTYLGKWLLPRTVEPTHAFPSRSELLSTNRRVILIANAPVAPGHKYCEGSDEYCEAEFVSGRFPVWTRNNQNFFECKDTLPGDEDGNHGGPALARRGEFTVIVEDRTLQRGLLPEPMGLLSVEDMVKVARCNYTIVATDFLGSALPLGRRLDLPDFSRHEAVIWSWKRGDTGQNGDCAMIENSSGRWASMHCERSHRFVCAPPRSESGTDTAHWRQFEDRWKITEAFGPWTDGPAACAAEFPFNPEEGTAYVFSVPVNGFQNEMLRQANRNGDPLWLNYTDQAKEGTWTIPKIEHVNTPPVANAGPDRRVECGHSTVLRGLRSFDADGDALTYSWTGPFGSLAGAAVKVTLAPGVHVITLTVLDGRDGSSTDTVSVTVRDTKSPTLSVALSPSALSPSDRRMVDVVADVQAEDACNGGDVGIELRSIVSNEPDDVEHPEPDIEGATFGVGDLEFSLRAERSRLDSSRVYTVTYRAVDAAGNTKRASACVEVDDTRPPVIARLTATPQRLSVVDGTMKRVSIAPIVRGECGAAVCKIVGVTSTDPSASPADWRITGDLMLRLRAESGDAPRTHRRYDVHVQCADASGNISSRIVSIRTGDRTSDVTEYP